MQATGVSPYRTLLAAIPVAAAGAALTLVLASEITPRTDAALAGWWRRSTPAAERHVAPPSWFRTRDAVVSVDDIGADGRRLAGVQAYRRTPGGALLERVTAKRAQWSDGWRLAEVARHRPEAASIVHSHAATAPWIGAAPSPAALRAIRRGPEETSSTSALATLVSGRPTDKARAYLVTRLNRILAQPLAPLVMLLLASPVLVGAGPRRSRAPQLAFALGGGLLYLVSDGLLTALGEAGDLPPVMAAWAAPVLFAGAGATALLFAEG